MKNFSSLINVLTVAVVVAASVFCVSAQESEGIWLNKRPLRDFGDEIKRDVDSKKIDLSGPFLVELRGKLDDKGKLDTKTSSFTRTEGDPALVEKAKRGILAIADAGYFQYLKALEVREFVLLTEQTSSDFQVRIVGEYETENRAKTVNSALNVMLDLSRAKKQGPNATDADKQDLFLLDRTNVRSEGKGVVISFKASAVEIQKLVAEKLAEQTKSG